MIPAISAAALGRRYRDQVALDNISLTVEPGTVTGLLGRNGAGKTTLMRIITGLEFPHYRRHPGVRAGSGGERRGIAPHGAGWVPGSRESAFAVDAAIGAVACATLWFRRRWPTGVALATIPPLILSLSAGVASLLRCTTSASAGRRVSRSSWPA
jgi:ABC-type Mn2+/Zn2+ transport system ATPase subunit